MEASSAWRHRVYGGIERMQASSAPICIECNNTPNAQMHGCREASSAWRHQMQRIMVCFEYTDIWNTKMHRVHGGIECMEAPSAWRHQMQRIMVLLRIHRIECTDSWYAMHRMQQHIKCTDAWMNGGIDCMEASSAWRHRIRIRQRLKASKIARSQST